LDAGLHAPRITKMLRQSWSASRSLWQQGTQPSRIVWQTLWKGKSASKGISSSVLARLPSKRNARFQPSRSFSTRPSSPIMGRLQATLRSPRRPFRFSARQRASQSSGQAEQEPLSFGAKWRKISREYGWVAVGVYFSLSVLDFPFCFALVRIIGTDKIGMFSNPRPTGFEWCMH